MSFSESRPTCAAMLVRKMCELDPSRLGRRLGGDRPSTQPEVSHRSRRRHVPEELSPTLHGPLLSLQLLLQLAEEAPIRTLGDDFLWTALDHSRLLQAERVEA